MPSVSLFEIINVVSNPKIFFFFFGIAESVANVVAVDPNGIKIVLVNGISTVFVNGKPVFINGLRQLSNPPLDY